MRLSLVLAAALATTASAAAAQDAPDTPAKKTLACEDPAFRQDEASPALTAADFFRPGELVFFDCRVAGYRTQEKDEIVRLKLSFTAIATDARGLKLAAPVSGRFDTELAAQDQDYRPRVRYRFELPVLMPGGVYRVEVVVRDEFAESEVRLARDFRVRAPEFTAREFGIRELTFLRGDAPIRQAVYRPGEAVTAKFDIVGFTVGEANRVAVSYSVSVQSPIAKVRLDDGSVTRYDDKSFYPVAYVPANFGVQLTPDSPKGEYRVTLKLRDEIANATREEQFTFRVE